MTTFATMRLPAKPTALGIGFSNAIFRRFLVQGYRLALPKTTIARPPNAG